jgi:uncharacterized protein YeaO (DUF488 family)
MKVKVKRVYEEPSASDGARVLVDRLWPRGLTKTEAALDAWLRDLAPSNELRKWFHANTEQWSAFKKRYLKELTQPEATVALEHLYGMAKDDRQLTLLFASKQEDRNNATVLRDLLQGMRKPPTGTGPGVARAMRERQVKRMPRR